MNLTFFDCQKCGTTNELSEGNVCVACGTFQLRRREPINELLPPDYRAKLEASEELVGPMERRIRALESKLDLLFERVMALEDKAVVITKL